MNTVEPLDIDALSHSLGITIYRKPPRRVTGGSISGAFRYETSGGPVFVKIGGKGADAMFCAEAAGLKYLAEARALRVPAVLGMGASDDAAFLALEWIDFSPLTCASEAKLGEQLAHQHRTTQRFFGWDRDNTLGSTPQINTWSDDWPTFFRDRRLGFQLQLAAVNGAHAAVIARGWQVCESIHAYFPGYRPVPALLHGDLWNGNRAVDAAGRPVIFDPAVYFGDREADIAMTRLFGGFGHAFYAAYQEAWPLDAGAQTRIPLYNLYHALNHYNLFGGGYELQAAAMIDTLLTTIGHR